jgi:hypothetical protein
VLSLRLPIVLGGIGLINLLSYTDTHHHITTGDWLFVLATFVVGAGLLGAIRAFTVQIWTSNNWVVRQGSWLTMGLWALSLGLHFVSGVGAKYIDAGNLEASSFLVYLALTYAVQNYVIHRRATPLWDALGPEAGHRLQVNFGPGPGGTGAFFATFRGGGPDFGPGPGPPRPRQTATDDPTIIDAEVVDEGRGPPELH